MLVPSVCVNNVLRFNEIRKMNGGEEVPNCFNIYPSLSLTVLINFTVWGSLNWSTVDHNPIFALLL